MLRITTVTGSTYEIDTDSKRMRRVSGDHAPTANQRADGAWRTYEEISPVVLGAGVVTVWGWEHTEEDGLVLRRTLTSDVVAIDFVQPRGTHGEQPAES
jgi:hypothetical protein